VAQQDNGDPDAAVQDRIVPNRQLALSCAAFLAIVSNAAARETIS